MSQPEEILVRLAESRDTSPLAAMFHSLWPDATPQEHGKDIAALIEGRSPGTLPAVILVAETGESDLAGFIHAGLRSHADGCDPSHPVGYIEGWYVQSAYRRRGVGARLVAAAEDWARALGCVEMASDTWLDNPDSQRAHEALRYEVVDRCVNYRKLL